MTNENDSVLDTNILLRYTNRDDPLHLRILDALERLALSGGSLYMARQSVMEFWSVATRPVEVNGLGLSVREARSEVDKLLEAFALLPDPPDLMERWLELCTQYEVKGRPSHDARLIALMEAHGIVRLLTLNAGDFKRYPGIRCFSPVDV